MKRLIVALIVLMASISIHAADANPARKPIKDEKVSFYANITAVEPVMEAFTAETGVKGEYTRISTSKFVAIALTEFEAGKLMADVVQAPLPVLDVLRDKGVLAEYTSPSAEGYPEWSHWDESIQLFGIECVSIIYNKDLVKKEDVPRRYEDLADPKWKDKIVMANPSNHPTTIAWLIALKEKVFPHEREWRKWLQGLAANRPMIVASFAPSSAPVESGEKLLAISGPKQVFTKSPAPLDWARMEDQPLFGTPRAIAITASAPHPEAARAFVDYWLSPESMDLLTKKVGEYVLAPGVPPVVEGLAQVQVEPIRELSDEEMQKWGAEFKKIFGI